MNRSPRVVYLDHSRVLFVPFINTFLYRIQIYFFEKELLNFVYIGKHRNKFRDRLLQNISKKATSVVVRSYKLVQLLKDIKPEIILDQNLKNIESLSKDDLYSLMWSLVFASSVTQKTKKTLKRFLPQDFPVKRTIVIPFNDPLDLVCDYIFQTAKVLSYKGNIVYLVALANPLSIFKYLLGKKLEKITRKEFFDKNNIFVIHPLTPFSPRFMSLKIIQKMHRTAITWYTSHFAKRVGADFFWCFDTSDVDFIKPVKPYMKTIYDCVDYFSSLDLVVDKKIKTDEVKLIRSVDFFFVNSQSLKRTKGEIRNPDAVVPQGFDIDAFASNKSLSSQEKKEIRKVRNLFKGIPKPRIGFVGNLTYRLDFKLLSSLINKMPKVSFVFTDAFLPIPADDRFVNTKKLIAKIRKSQNVYFIPKTFSRRVIKAALENFNIGMIPYDSSFDFNKYCYPMKLFEYFYMGLPVISTPIEELKRFPKFIKLGRNAVQWGKIIDSLLLESWAKKYKYEQRKLAKKNSWDYKISKIIDKLDDQSIIYTY